MNAFKFSLTAIEKEIAEEAILTRNQSGEILRKYGEEVGLRIQKYPLRASEHQERLESFKVKLEKHLRQSLGHPRVLEKRPTP